VQLGLQALQRDQWTVLHVAGEIDMATSPELRQRVVSLVAEGANYVIIDLSAVGFCDSTGLGVLVAVVKRVRTNGGDLRVVTDDPRMIDLFELTRLDRVFGVFHRVDDAVAAPIGTERDADDR